MDGGSITKIGHRMDSKVSKDSTTPPQKLEMHCDGRAPNFEVRRSKLENDPFRKQTDHGSGHEFASGFDFGYVSDDVLELGTQRQGAISKV